MQTDSGLVVSNATDLRSINASIFTLNIANVTRTKVCFDDATDCIISVIEGNSYFGKIDVYVPPELHKKATSAKLAYDRNDISIGLVRYKLVSSQEFKEQESKTEEQLILDSMEEWESNKSAVLCAIGGAGCVWSIITVNPVGAAISCLAASIGCIDVVKKEVYKQELERVRKKKKNKSNSGSGGDGPTIPGPKVDYTEPYVRETEFRMRNGWSEVRDWPDSTGSGGCAEIKTCFPI
ncbi:hypothetical protein [Pseudobacteriovorax antillogorgiicola]|uniref:Uncharacterized protein n=1 Tax=Pseudobacteriovorax antillogorgiicola TaxID=1513793 RepID=A0A1Y6CEL0_9BACT|nr:hypothetical protein [Pseudobacteriovorax antillogorgiicola]TCS47695.1 hypothetical protein EDD56_120136 [Pseudobacteriovorax antillogorgiicola]SMF59461.1 hypothetical protein SAMN06296036_1204 [Pseudobacteriovorax antillogorgiicola]